jgi:hypothetical protein
METVYSKPQLEILLFDFNFFEENPKYATEKFCIYK